MTDRKWNRTQHWAALASAAHYSPSLPFPAGNSAVKLGTPLPSRYDIADFLNWIQERTEQFMFKSASKDPSYFFQKFPKYSSFHLKSDPSWEGKVSFHPCYLYPVKFSFTLFVMQITPPDSSAAQTARNYEQCDDESLSRSSRGQILLN